jgi:hypothetical protein
MKLMKIKRRRVLEGKGGELKGVRGGRGVGELEFEFLVWSAVW